MNDFDALCEILERLDPETYNQIYEQKSVGIVKALSGIMEDGRDGVAIFMDFILAAVAADGKLAEDEFLAIRPGMEAILGRSVSYGDALEMFMRAGLDEPEGLKAEVDLMVDVIGLLSPELKEDIVLICLMVCAVDGKVCDSEKAWIKQLIE